MVAPPSRRLPARAPPQRAGRRRACRSLLFAAAYYAYRLVRGCVDGPGATAAFENARDVIDLERSLHLFVEPDVQAWVERDRLDHRLRRAGCTSTRTSTVTSARSSGSTCAATAASTSCATCSWSRWASRSSATCVFPTAPPRLLPEWGFSRLGRRLHRRRPDSATVNALFNPYAAVPVDARRVRADGRHPAVAARQARALKRLLGRATRCSSRS